MIDPAVFQNLMRAARTLDRSALATAGVIPAGLRGLGLWRTFNSDFTRFCLRLNERQCGAFLALLAGQGANQA